MLGSSDCNAAFLHGLQKRGLGARAGTIDFIRHQQLAEDRAGHETEAAAALLLIEDLAADNVGRHQVWGELDALGSEAEDDAECLDQPAFPKPRQAHEQHVAAAEKGNQGLINDVLLAEDDAPDGGANQRDAGAERFYLRHGGMRADLCGRRHANRHSVLHTRNPRRRRQYALFLAGGGYLYRLEQHTSQCKETKT